jgi:pilus assembly protein CpaC
MRKLTYLLLVGIWVSLGFAEDKVTVFVGQSTVLDFPQTIKRVSIANTDIADASVTSTSQLLINGKTAGVTSLVVWNEQEHVKQFKLLVQKERSASTISRSEQKQS